MTAVVGIDDTDSRERGMCTTYVASRIADRLAADGATVERVLLVRLNPAVEFKTRGNAALAIHVDGDPDRAFDVACEVVSTLAEVDDPNTNPGVVVADHAPSDALTDVTSFAQHAVGDHHDRASARNLIVDRGYHAEAWGDGRGLIGALAAVGAWGAFDDWTYEFITYREPERWGTPRAIDHDSVVAAADEHYPAVWDTVDRGEGQSVCVPHTPGPVLHGIRGDDPETVRAVAESIEGEATVGGRLFVTNQGTDAHLRGGTLGAVDGGRSYRVTGRVVESPETREGGHVFFAMGDGRDRLQCAAFEPTKRFRDRVRSLRVGDRITACGEVSAGTLKLEKFAVRDLVRSERAVPRCPDCGRSMESAGRGQGYRCRECGTATTGKVERSVERDIETGWYEVPPCARRHVAKPLVRGGFDAPTHPEK